jgi:CheY-like chemotaxis protein
MIPDYTGSRQNRFLPILVVEDNPDHQHLILHSLQHRLPEAQPVFTSSMEETLAYLTQCANVRGSFPQLVLLDIHLPKPEQGWQLLKELKVRYPRLPVLALSAHQDADTIRQAYELGIHSFLAKPLVLPDWERYFAVLRTYWLDVVTLPPAY